MSVIMRYQDQVLSDVRDVLWNIKENKGKSPSSLLDRLWKEKQGSWNSDVLNIALVAMGKKKRYIGKTTDEQFSTLVAKA